MHTGGLLVEKLTHLDVALADAHNSLVRRVGAADRDSSAGIDRMVMALKDHHAAWRRYRHSECELMGSMNGVDSGWQSVSVISCELNLTDQRLRRVRSAMRCVGRTPEADRVYSQSQCLQQLLPLVNKVK